MAASASSVGDLVTAFRNGVRDPALALDRLESGWPIRDLLDVLADMKDSRALSQPLRHRALRLWRAATRT
ncbi:hypothetical protein GCM10009687_06510 [Asanoa iriomotensis]